MTASATHVPVSGFQAPPAAAPVVQTPQGFAPIPDAGPPPRLPGSNGQAHQYVGQTPGMLPAQPAAQLPGQAPAAAAPAAGMDIAALLQQALAAVQPEGTPTPTPAAAIDAVAKPAWLAGESANTFDVSKIDDPILKSMATFMQTAAKGLDLDRALGNALAHSDVSLIDHAYIAEKGGANAPQISDMAKGIVAAIEAQSNAVTAAVHSLAGGEAQWSQSAAVFNQVAPQELKHVVKFMMDSTSKQNILAAAKIVTEFGRASGQLPKQGAPLLGGPSGGTLNTQGITSDQFKDLHFKLDPNARDYEQARNDLFTRRAMGRRAGL